MIKKHGSTSNQKGFTLLEILIVVIILGILAALAIPVYSAARERAVRQEALQQLAAARESQLRYHSANGAYDSSQFVNVDFNPNTSNPGVTPHYSYSVQGAGGSAFTIAAVRNGTAPASSVYTITVNEAGTLVG